MKEYTNFYIDGQWVAPVKPTMIDVINPATEKAYAKIALGTAADVDRAVSAARTAFATYSETSVSERLAMLSHIVKVYQKCYDEMAQTISQEMGAPITLATQAQAAAGLGHLETSFKVLRNYSFEYIHEGNTIRKEPIGVCGFITPWNWPINQIASKVGPALAAGCTIVLKPSEISPLSAVLFAEILDEARVPPGVFNLVQGYGPEVGEAMSRHPEIDMMSFTGSTRGGIAVARAAADTVKRVGQELGGKSPHILLDDAALCDNVYKGVQYCMSNTGQSCNAPTRMLIPAHRREAIAAYAVKAIADLKVGDPSNPESDLGPLVSDAQF
ncbi:MAG: aldehyde dehydrogenase family protein, partial [Alphaproteobacteria bacterium]|nr:aldehyde dehydrogenase family protein [Alphaproteobacteria bacterium]